MKALILLLSAAAVALSITCVRLYQKLGDEQEMVRVSVDERRTSPAQRVVAAALPPPAVAPTPVAKPVPHIDGSEVWDAARRKVLEDPAAREVLRERYLAEFRASQPTLRQDLELTQEQYEQLMTLLADQQLALAEAYLANDTLDVNALRKEQRGQVAALLGLENEQAYETYLRSLPIRDEVRQFRGQLNQADALTDDQSKRLVAALLQNREAFQKEQAERYAGQTIDEQANGWDGSKFIAGHAAGASIEDQLVEQMRTYYETSARSAARVLAPSQLAQFERTLELRMAQRRGMLLEEMQQRARAVELQQR